MVLLLVITSTCKNKKDSKRVNLKLLFTTNITNNSFGGNTEFNSKLALSDSIFAQKEYIMAHTAGYNGTPETYLFIRGKKVSGNYNFDSLVKKYHLKEIDLQEMVKHKNDSLSISEYKKYRIKHIAEKTGKNTISLMKLKNGSVIYYIDSVSDKNVLHISNYGILSTFYLKSNSDLFGSFIKLYDITGDGKEEVFILSPKTSYWGYKWFVEVYDVNRQHKVD